MAFFFSLTLSHEHFFIWWNIYGQHRSKLFSSPLTGRHTLPEVCWAGLLAWRGSFETCGPSVRNSYLRLWLARKGPPPPCPCRCLTTTSHSATSRLPAACPRLRCFLPRNSHGRPHVPLHLAGWAGRLPNTFLTLASPASWLPRIGTRRPLQMGCFLPITFQILHFCDSPLLLLQTYALWPTPKGSPTFILRSLRTGPLTPSSLLRDDTALGGRWCFPRAATTIFSVLHVLAQTSCFPIQGWKKEFPFSWKCLSCGCPEHGRVTFV